MDEKIYLIASQKYGADAGPVDCVVEIGAGASSVHADSITFVSRPSLLNE